MHHAFGELRSILHQSPNHETWLTLCEHLNTWPQDELVASALPYALKLIHAWPSHIGRDAPSSWWLEPEQHPKLILATSLYISRPAPRLDLTTLLSCPHLTNLDRLVLDGVELTTERASARHEPSSQTIKRAWPEQNRAWGPRPSAPAQRAMA